MELKPAVCATGVHQCNLRCEGEVHYDVLYDVKGYEEMTFEDFKVLLRDIGQDLQRMKEIYEHEPMSLGQPVKKAYGTYFKWRSSPREWFRVWM